ncbi:MAG: hypothetical protein DWQ36_07585 [Acidobacteria bacterium]|nr:MAG: hypothetical protein DWQ30_11730 [Acidobacteriota bacterium]REK09178.1 MAG: hypothetical protein DWQ36_07585 [Acidobacteriota bacterium]
MQPGAPHPLPGPARVLLGLAVPSERREDVVGDLVEVHADRRNRLTSTAAWWATSAEATLLALAFLVYRLRDRDWSIWAWPTISASDVRHGLRLMRRNALMAGISAAALTLGLTVAVTGFTMLSGTFFSSLPFDDGARFVRLDLHAIPSMRYARLDLERHGLFSAADSFLFFGAEDTDVVSVLHPSGTLEAVRGNWITAGVFEHLPYRPLLGRNLVREDGSVGSDPVVVIRESLWRRSFGADRAVVGRRVDIGGESRSVVGVLPDEAGFPSSPELWLPLDDRNLGGSNGEPKPGLEHFGILRAGVSAETATARLQTLSELARTENPELDGLRVTVTPYTQGAPQERRAAVVVVIVLLTLLAVVAASLANLTLTRTSARMRELSVRATLGAPRTRLVAQLSLESLLAGLVAAVTAVGLSQVAVRHLSTSLEAVPFWVDFDLDWRTVLFTVGATLLACALGGVVPALRATAQSDERTWWNGSAPRLGRLGSTLMVLEIAASVLLLTAALVVARGLASQAAVSLPVPEERILTARVSSPHAGPTAEDTGGESDRAGRDLLEVLDRLRQGPGIEAAGAARRLPKVRIAEQRFHLAVTGDDDIALTAATNHVSAGFLESLAIRPVVGRLFDSDDQRPGAPPVALVTTTFGDRYLRGRSPLGEKIGPVGTVEASADPNEWFEIVGVIPDDGLGRDRIDDGAAVLLPMRGAAWPAGLVVRTSSSAEEWAVPLWTVVTQVDPRLQVSDVRPLTEVGRDEQVLLAGLSSVLVAMGLLVLGLSSASLYAMVCFDVVRRRREIGVRVALGASRANVLWDVMRGTGSRLVLGCGLGLTGVALVSVADLSRRALDLPTDGLTSTTGLVMAILSMAAALASWGPARRALKISPRDALQQTEP